MPSTPISIGIACWWKYTSVREGQLSAFFSLLQIVDARMSIDTWRISIEQKYTRKISVWQSFPRLSLPVANSISDADGPSRIRSSLTFMFLTARSRWYSPCRAHISRRRWSQTKRWKIQFPMRLEVQLIEETASDQQSLLWRANIWTNRIAKWWEIRLIFLSVLFTHHPLFDTPVSTRSTHHPASH